MIIPLNQNVLIEREKNKEKVVTLKSGIVTPTGQIENEGLVYGTVLYAPKDQNLLIDNDRKINDVEIKKGDKVWYSQYSAGIILNDSEDVSSDNRYLDLVPLEDIRAIVS